MGWTGAGCRLKKSRIASSMLRCAGVKIGKLWGEDVAAPRCASRGDATPSSIHPNPLATSRISPPPQFLFFRRVGTDKFPVRFCSFNENRYGTRRNVPCKHGRALRAREAAPRSRRKTPLVNSHPVDKMPNENPRVQREDLISWNPSLNPSSRHGRRKYAMPKKSRVFITRRRRMAWRRLRIF